MPDEGVGRLNSNAVNGLLHVFMKSRGRIRGIYAHNVRLPLLRMCFCFCLFMMHVFSADFSELQASGPYVISSVHPSPGRAGVFTQRICLIYIHY